MSKRLVSYLILCSCMGNVCLASADPFDFDIDTESQSSNLVSVTTLDEKEESLQEKTFWDSWDYRFSGIIDTTIRKNIVRHGYQTSRLRLDTSLKITGPIDAFINAKFDYDEAARKWHEETSATLYEAYISDSLSFSNQNGITYALGKQRISWAVTDGVTTTDLLNALDFKDPIASGRTLKRFSSWAAKLQVGSALGTSEFVYLPIGKERRKAKKDSPWELSTVYSLRESAERNEISLEEKFNPHKPEFALRHMVYGEGFDIGVVFHNGLSDIPVMTSRYQDKLCVKLEPIRQRTYSLLAAATIENSTIRAEVAFQDKAAMYDKLGKLYLDKRVEYILGWDRNFDYDIYANIQFFHDWYQASQDDYGVTYALNQQYFNQALTLGVSGFLGYHNEHTVEVYAEYAVSDSFKVRARYFDIGGGISSSMYADFAKNDFVEIGASYFF